MAVLSDPAATAEQQLDACAQLIRFGEIGPAVTHLSGLIADPRHERRAKSLLQRARRLRRLGGGQPARGAPIEEIPDDRGFWVAPAKSETTIIAFTGKGKRLSVSIYFMRRLLRRRQANAIFLFDWEDNYYLKGVVGLGDSVAATADSLRQICRDLGTKRLICLGQSLGGYGAIRYGLELGADGILAFSPVIVSLLQGAAHERVTAAFAGSPPSLDLRPQFGAIPRPPLTRIVYGEENEADRASALMLSGSPGVALHPLPGVARHGTVEATAVSGEFGDLLDGVMTAIGPGRWR